MRSSRYTGPMLAYRAVTLSYGDTMVLRDVDLSIADGEFVALVGPSGAGKTTLLKLANRLVEATGGSVEVAGRDVRTVPVHDLRRGIGYAFQGVGLFPHMTVAENVAAVPRLLGWDAARQAARVTEMLDLVELPRDFAGRRPSQLSGGQASRVGLARALAAGAKLLLLDEPFGALDPETRISLGDALVALHARTGLTTVMVTHDLHDALLRAPRVVVLANGRVVADASPAELTRSADPVVRALVAAPVDQARRLAALAGRA